MQRGIKGYLFILLWLGISCNADDDICNSSESSPRIKLKFKNQATGKVRSLDSVFVYVDYGEGMQNVVYNTYSTDSLFIPLRVDNSPFTEMELALSSQGTRSQIKISYTPEDVYVSPACGFKKQYKNLSAENQTTAPVKAIEISQNEITHEDKTHLYLLF